VSPVPDQEGRGFKILFILTMTTKVYPCVADVASTFLGSLTVFVKEKEESFHMNIPREESLGWWCN
jgi:hypothetical protein